MRSIFGILCCLLSFPASAHVIQHLTWFQVERTISVTLDELRITHECRFDPERFEADDRTMDKDGDSSASQREIADFCAQASRYLMDDLLVTHRGRPLKHTQDLFKVLPDSTGFRSEIVAPLSKAEGELQIVDPTYLLPGSAKSKARPTRLVTEDGLALHLGKSDDRATTVPSALHTTLRLTHPDSDRVTDETMTTGVPKTP